MKRRKKIFSSKELLCITVWGEGISIDKKSFSRNFYFHSQSYKESTLRVANLFLSTIKRLCKVLQGKRSPTAPTSTNINALSTSCIHFKYIALHILYCFPLHIMYCFLRSIYCTACSIALLCFISFSFFFFSNKFTDYFVNNWRKCHLKKR